MLNPTSNLQDQVFQQNQGLIASINGEYTTVYRNATNVNRSLLDSDPIFTVFPALLTRTTTRTQIENSMFELLMFQGICDSRYLQYGDLVVDNASGEMYVYGNRRPRTAAMFVRVETLVTIGMPFNPGSAARTGRAPGGNFVPNYGFARNDISRPLTLTNGTYAIGAPGDPAAQLLVGVQIKNQIGSPHDPGIPNAILKSNFALYVPPLTAANGTDLTPPMRENMIVSVVGSDTQYVVLSCATNMQGFVGTVCIVQKADI
jgi:hypothetical protein